MTLRPSDRDLSRYDLAYDTAQDWTPLQLPSVAAVSGPPARFLATMTHELRTPLNVVIGFSDAMMREQGPPLGREQVIEYAASINGAGRQLLALLDIILDVARVENGQLALSSDLMDVAHVVTAAVTQSAEAARAGAISLHGEAEAGLPLMRGDERRLRLAVGHMLGNAIKFTPSGGAVRIAARRDERSGDLLVLVSDTGIGIAVADLQRVFEPFVQLDAGHSRRFSGSGLGLYVSRVTARAHGGDILVSSRPGVGTTAVLRLPAGRLVAPPAELLA